ncbi:MULTISPECIES: glycogen debranching protein GlgX [unclassified Novosphingobium]|uniref:glycogen debranching protein GlgX n=1 Tax=unclassified Novosphingobium TaxID=2644732 RepID=UPI00146A90A7|nr:MULTISPECIES: glycogen debranching protein GlgX [unclassified Novosphingobium]NMN03580.1 glycogen operon protein [Novosphingobium sp. SG919]NMN86430.1 glycogen operon protein [Novosphingobium sp. SG916]
MPYGAHACPGGTAWRVRAPLAEAVWLCLFDGAAETRHAMVRDGDDWTLTLPGSQAGVRYGYRAGGEWAPERGLWFDPAKLLVDPYAVELDQRFAYEPALSALGADTAALVPKAVVPGDLPTVPPAPPLFAPGGLIYEVNVRAFTMLHPHVPQHLRGTVAALAHPAVVAHLKKLRVNAVELMPIVAWIEERHLPPLGLTNAWGYNPVGFMALDPGLCPGGLAELRETVAALRAAGIGTILDLVFNHTGESDLAGPIVGLRGLDNQAYAHDPAGQLINDTGCGNTLDFANPHVRRLTLDALRHFVAHAGVDGFRFDLAPILARGPGFAADAPIFAEIAADPLLADRVLIAEPWDIGPDGYQLGRFPANWLEWNDRFRDDARRFWRGDGALGELATRLAGSADVFGPCDATPCRSVNFLAAHDGFTLADCVAFARKHNHANGEDNRDGHDDNFSWNNGVEGSSDDPAVQARRSAALRALLGTLFASTGTIMLTAGDEFGRSQQGNNNAYAQDNALTWIDWQGRDHDLENFVAQLAAKRAGGDMARFPEDGQWLALDGAPMDSARWEDPATPGVAWHDPAGIRPGFRVSRADGVALG